MITQRKLFYSFTNSAFLHFWAAVFCFGRFFFSLIFRPLFSLNSANEKLLPPFPNSSAAFIFPHGAYPKNKRNLIAAEAIILLEIFSCSSSFLPTFFFLSFSLRQKWRRKRRPLGAENKRKYLC